MMLEKRNPIKSPALAGQMAGLGAETGANHAANLPDLQAVKRTRAVNQWAPTMADIPEPFGAFLAVWIFGGGATDLRGGPRPL